MKLDIANNAYFSAGTLFEQAVCKVNADGTNGWLALASSGYNTDFDFGNDYSIYMVGGLSTAHFTQAPIITCDPPVGLFTNNITTTKARLNWTIEPGAVQYEVWYKKATAINWKKKFIAGASNKLTLKNLQCNTNYVWKIRTVCDTVGIDLVSAFSADQLFTTAVCREGDIETQALGMEIFPNPATNDIAVSISDPGTYQISIYDLNGNLLLQQSMTNELPNGIIQLHVESLPNGLYVVRVAGEEVLRSEKLIIAR
jgi:hypothetical protein